MVDDIILHEIGRSKLLRSLLERASVEEAWLGREAGIRMSDKSIGRKLVALGLGEMFQKPVTWQSRGTRMVWHFRLTPLGEAAAFRIDT